MGKNASSIRHYDTPIKCSKDSNGKAIEEYFHWRYGEKNTKIRKDFSKFSKEYISKLGGEVQEAFSPPKIPKAMRRPLEILNKNSNLTTSRSLGMGGSIITGLDRYKLYEVAKQHNTDLTKWEILVDTFEYWLVKSEQKGN